MATSKIRIVLKTSADDTLLRLSPVSQGDAATPPPMVVQTVDLDANGAAEVDVLVQAEYRLGWDIIGDPATEYKVTLSAVESNKEITMTSGKNPYPSAISTLLFAASGSVRFKLNEKKKMAKKEEKQ